MSEQLVHIKYKGSRVENSDKESVKMAKMWQKVERKALWMLDVLDKTLGGVKQADAAGNYLSVHCAIKLGKRGQ
jgi:hypothetical protein